MKQLKISVLCTVKNFIYLFVITAFFLSSVIIYQDEFHFPIQSFLYSVLNPYYGDYNFTIPSDNKTVILAWTNFHGYKWEEFEKLFDECPPELKCVPTKNRSLLKESAAVLFHVRALYWKDRPPVRSPDQYYVFALWESPSYKHFDYFDYEKHRDFFNLTMTYRRDSDIVWPYGDFQKIDRSIDRSKLRTFTDINFVNITSRKTKSIAWFASNCKSQSGRERFVKKLSKSIPVDIYGKCGKLSCEWTEKFSLTSDRYKETACHQMLTKDYKFYLSLENSICRDYVTEKFYLIMMYSFVVPVVLNRKILLQTVPDAEVAEALNKSFIAVDDFSTVPELAEYLKYLDKNTTAYTDYFKWRNNFRIVMERYKHHPGCELCRIVKEKKERKMNDVYRWWVNDANCQTYK